MKHSNQINVGSHDVTSPTGYFHTHSRYALHFLTKTALCASLLFASLAYAEYSVEYILHPDANDFTQCFGVNNAGDVACQGSSDTKEISFTFNIKTGEYKNIDEASELTDSLFGPLGINNSGAMVGNFWADYWADGVCSKRDKDGNLSAIPMVEDPGNPIGHCSARALNERGDVTGFVIREDGTWAGWIHDASSGVTEEIMPNPVRSIAQGISASGAVVGTTAVNGVRGAFLREKDGTIKTFQAANADAIPHRTNARGISDNGKVITGFYQTEPFLESIVFVVNSSALTDDPLAPVELTPIDIPNCGLGTVAPQGYIVFIDVFAQAIRNDGVIVGQCSEILFDLSIFEIEEERSVGFVAIPE